jgi:hypothetical protein
MPRAARSYVPSVKPARGVIVRLDGAPGLWQITDPAPGHGLWWLVAADEDARSAPSYGFGKGYARAAAAEMTRS